MMHVRCTEGGSRLIVRAMPHARTLGPKPRVRVKQPQLTRAGEHHHGWASRVPAGRFFSRMPPAMEPVAAHMVVLTGAR